LFSSCGQIGGCFFEHQFVLFLHLFLSSEMEIGNVGEQPIKGQLDA